MTCITHYSSPLGRILLAADDIGLTGLWFSGQKYFPAALEGACETRDLPVFDAARRWLDLYFSGKQPDFTVPLHPIGTDFQLRVWTLLRDIPYGQTVTYGNLAARLGLASAQAVGGAVGRNPISILIPCHRVVGANGSLTGYAGGLEKKQALLRLEGTSLWQHRPHKLC